MASALVFQCPAPEARRAPDVVAACRSSPAATVNEVSGTEVLVPGYLYHYQLDASKAGSELMSSARVVADVPHQFDDQLNPQQLAERASSAKGPLDLITLRPSDHDKVALALDALPGVVVIPQPDMLPTEEDFAPAVVSEVKRRCSTNSTARLAGGCSA